MAHTPDVRSRREAAGLSQFELGMRVGIDPGRLSKIERGLGSPTLEQAVALQRELGIPVETWVAAAAPATEQLAAVGG